MVKLLLFTGDFKGEVYRLYSVFCAIFGLGIRKKIYKSSC
uniref:Uncharacterized protein n=1 Tax=Anguilla anguilla TaxID=7936 RepID=A0A0E9QHK3_ANGAN